MKQWTWLALAGLLTTLSCGSDEAVQPTSDYADAWVGEYEGTGNFALSNGISGQDRPVSMSIARVSPKKVTVSATLVYGEGRNDFFQAIDILQPDDPDQITLEVRYLNAKTVYAFTQDEGTITGSIASSSLRLGGTWGQDQIMTGIEVVRQ
ncbi:MAG: hypothetical protein F4Y91_17845 [Gemmatimonadetes bacterium]|nr:hypothetical protein [Gemmatimonadota bacterium]MYB69008.1 hypothetical protein [Gemmatimonadota bacterium]